MESSKKSKKIVLKKTIYTSCYCEENIYKLVEPMKGKQKVLDKIKVLYITSDNERFPIWFQKNDKNKVKLTVWDYHVIAIHEQNDGKSYAVYDFDSMLGFGIDFLSYLKRSIMTTKVLCEECKEEFKGKTDDELSEEERSKVKSMKELGEMLLNTKFRVVGAATYLKWFSSDRSHMKKEDGTYYSPPPKYKCIVNENGDKMNINEFKTTKDNDEKKYGKVYSLAKFVNVMFNKDLSEL